VERVATCLSASLLVRHAPAFVSDAYAASRLGGERGSEYGTLAASVDARALCERAWPSS